jgi:hypothetical protein
MMRILFIAALCIVAFAVAAYKIPTNSAPNVPVAQCADPSKSTGTSNVIDQSHNTDLQPVDSVRSESAAQPAASSKTTGASDVIYQSRDGGKNWQDISQGLPEDFGIIGGFVQNGTIYMASERAIYQANASMVVPDWRMENTLIDRVYSLFAIKSGIVMYNSKKHFLREVPGLGVWSQAFPDLSGKVINSLYETQTAIFAGSEDGIFRSTNNGISWSQVFPDKAKQGKQNWVRHMYEVPGALVAQSGNAINISSDGGTTWTTDQPFWQKQIGPEGYVSFSCQIKSQLVAVVNHATETNKFTTKVFTSLDLGKTWVPNNAMFPFPNISSVLQAGVTLACCHHGGISISNDQGKTWELVFSFMGENRNYRLMHDNGVIYLVRDTGC